MTEFRLLVNALGAMDRALERRVMERYIGTKIVLAEPEMKDGRDGYAVVYEDGYRSWSPKETFEHAYRLLTYGELNLVIDKSPTPAWKRGS
jgi:hypothetical protein